MKLLTKERILTVSMLLGTAMTILFGSFAVFAEQCEELPDRLFRLHILANSDSEEDQELKYELRDMLLSDMKDIFSGCTSAQDAAEAAKKALPRITAKAQEFVDQQGSDCLVTASVEKTFFTTRRYGSYVVPAGYYDALRIVIGEGEGHNWWCVMFPPLCLGAAEGYVQPEEELMLCKSGSRARVNGKLSLAASRHIEQDNDFEIRFRLLEWLEELF